VTTKSVRFTLRVTWWVGEGSEEEHMQDKITNIKEGIQEWAMQGWNMVMIGCRISPLLPPL
jgi:hypothetical protein